MYCHFPIIAINPDHTQGDNVSITFGQQIPIDPAVAPRNVGVHVRLTELLERPESCASTYECWKLWKLGRSMTSVMC